jgi:hypothetical protein
MTFGCGHLSEKMAERRQLTEVAVARFPDKGEPDKVFRVDLELNYCSQCSDTFGFPALSSDLPTELFSEMYDKGFVPVCFRCLDELSNRSE